MQRGSVTVFLRLTLSSLRYQTYHTPSSLVYTCAERPKNIDDKILMGNSRNNLLKNTKLHHFISKA